MDCSDASKRINNTILFEKDFSERDDPEVNPGAAPLQEGDGMEIQENKPILKIRKIPPPSFMSLPDVQFASGSGEEVLTPVTNKVNKFMVINCP